MKFPLLLIIVSFARVASAQDSMPVIKSFYKDKPTSALDSFIHAYAPNTIFISLDEGFDDSICVTVNGVVFLNEYLKTNESINYAGGFGISFKDSSEIKEMKILFVKANRYILEKVNLGYKSLRVTRYLKRWNFIYSNTFPLRE